MANGGRPCCLLGVCCPPGSQEQIDAMTHWFMKHAQLEDEPAARAAEAVLKAFDLAPAGSLKDFKAAVAKLAKDA